MKKIISILLLIILVFSLAACNKSNNTSSELDADAQSDVSIVDTSSQNNTTSNKNSESEQSSSEEEIKPQLSSESPSNIQSNVSSGNSTGHSTENTVDDNSKKAEKYCSSCGEGISKNAAFCEYCGVPTNDIKTDNNNGEVVFEIECPRFVCQSIEEIKKNTEYTDNFNFEMIWEHNKDFEYGYVYKQSEPEGKKLQKDTKITLYISMGKSTQRVPDVYGKNEAAAVVELKSYGFDVVISEEPSDDVEKGLVIRTEPIRTTNVFEGERITVIISSGGKTGDGSLS